METGSQGRPQPRDAREQLEQLGKDEEAVRYPPLPRWFFGVTTTATAALYLAQLLSPSDARNATFALGVVVAVIAAFHWLNRPGVSWASMKFRDMVPFVASLGVIFVVCTVISETTSLSWVWIVGAAVAAGMVWRNGRAYRKEFGDA
ncbi:hypothetical protein [Kribbella italica]|uniref:Phosphatidylserine synthase n=1 Tax=Kribbella italica TaxID=1540520 RepID=A0A7W9J4S6_9ACTN|nr:hypothetical protein [Kribbella italica]MBB5835609.1 phosphatidylserine synthase [Kribbella italica]